MQPTRCRSVKRRKHKKVPGVCTWDDGNKRNPAMKTGRKAGLRVKEGAEKPIAT